jgi:hypothetical protein
MLGFNGGLIGGLANARDTSADPFVPGVWTLSEQRKAQIAGLWPVGGLKILDTYPGASAAYSLRLLSNTYTGILVTVRRSSDDTTQGFTRAQIEGFGSGSLTAFCTGTNGFVTTWHDQSGNGNNATQSTQANQPQIVTNGAVNLLNSKPCLSYVVGGNTSMTLATRLTGIVSVFEVLKLDFNVTDSDVNFLLGDSTTTHYHSGSGTWLGGNALAAVRNGTNLLNNVVTDFSTTTRTANQVLISMTHAGTATASQITQDRSNTNRSIRGRMQELILYSSSQSSNVSAISANINAYYNIYA